MTTSFGDWSRRPARRMGDSSLRRKPLSPTCFSLLRFTCLVHSTHGYSAAGVLCRAVVEFPKASAHSRNVSQYVCSCTFLPDALVGIQVSNGAAAVAQATSAESSGSHQRRIGLSEVVIPRGFGACAPGSQPTVCCTRPLLCCHLDRVTK